MLTIDEIRNSTRERSKRSNIPQMEMHQDWVRMHTDTDFFSVTKPAARRFLSMVQTLIPSEKYAIFTSLLRSPLPTVALTSVIFDRLSRIFEGRNTVHNYQFQSTQYADDWEWYRTERLHEPNVWKTKGWEYYKTEPNSVLVVDIPVEKQDKDDQYIEPYFYWVSTKDILDYSSDDEGKIEWIIFKNDDLKKVYAIDDAYYRTFDYDSTPTDLSLSYIENAHGLGYCPCMFFVDEPVSLSTPDVKASPITKVLSELDWYLFYATSKKHLDLYGSYPIYSGYASECDYEADIEVDGHIDHQYCEHGFLRHEDGSAVVTGANNTHAPCPRCSKSRVAGPGSYVEVPAPTDGMPDMRNPIQILTVDKDALQYNSEELKRKKNDIISMCVGTSDSLYNDFSVSDKQIEQGYESQSTILTRVKKRFENAQRFVDETCCRLRYGKEFLSADIDYGTDFYALTTEQLRKRYAIAKEGGASESDLLSLRKQIIETEYRNNPLQLQRLLIMADLEPLEGLSKAEAKEAYASGFVSEEDIRVKMNFDSLLKRFERENTNIIEFGVNKPYAEKIRIIKETLNGYVQFGNNNAGGVSSDGEEGRVDDVPRQSGVSSVRQRREDE